MEKIKLGFAMCGSFCTFNKVLEVYRKLADSYELLPIMSETAANTDTRFGKAELFREVLEEYSGKNVIDTIALAEPIGPKKLLDALVIAPCTGNTIAKLAAGIADSSVTLAAKAHLRNGRPLILAVSTNDGLGANARNIGQLMARENVYFVPFGQDDAEGKPDSLVADFDKIDETVLCALCGRQIQPLLT